MRTLIVGLGAMGHRHANVLQRSFPTGEVAFVDPVVPGESGLEKLKNIGQAVSWRPDYAIVSTRNEAHEEIASELIRNSIPVLIEKPATGSVSALSRLIKLRDQVEVQAWVGYVERFNPAINAVRRFVSMNKVGKPLSISMERLSGLPSSLWFGDVAIDLMSHDLDLVRHIFGEEIERSMIQRSAVGDAHPHAELLGVTLGGVSVALKSSWLHPVKKRHLKIIGDLGVLECDLLSMTIRIDQLQWDERHDENHGSFRGAHPVSSTSFSPPAREPLREMHLAIQESMLRGDSPSQGRIAVLEDAMAVHELLERSSHV